MFLQDKTILIVENDLICQKLYRDLFTIAPCRILLFESAEGVLAAVKTERPDLIIMDIGLPVISGLELTQDIKADPETAIIPILAITAFTFAQDLEKIKESGCDMILAKPFKINALLAHIQQLLLG